MQIKNRFEVPLAPDAAWALLMDVAQTAACFPGAELTESLDADHHRGRVSVRLGPVAMVFAGTIEIAGRDEISFLVGWLDGCEKDDGSAPGLDGVGIGGRRNGPDHFQCPFLRHAGGRRDRQSRKQNRQCSHVDLMTDEHVCNGHRMSSS